jgi:hypothetical protein
MTGIMTSWIVKSNVIINFDFKINSLEKYLRPGAFTLFYSENAIEMRDMSIVAVPEFYNITLVLKSAGSNVCTFSKPARYQQVSEYLTPSIKVN